MSGARRKAVTAWRLADGAVVYLTQGNGWSGDIAAARLTEDEQEAAAMMALAEEAVARQDVVGPYLFDVVLAGGKLRPRRLREVIRATGPTVGHSLRADARA